MINIASASVHAPETSTTTAVTSGLTAGHIYVITSLGTTTQAEWESIGLPAGFTAAVGQAFVATDTGTGGSHTGKVGLPAASPIVKMDIVGDPGKSIANSNASANSGASILVSMLAATASGDTALIPTAPADGSIIRMTIKLDNSSVTVDGL